MTDSEILTQIQYSLLEDPDGGLTSSSGLWTPAEFHDALTNAQQWVLREARPIFNRLTLYSPAGDNRMLLPQDWLITQRVVWHDADGGKIDLPRDSSWSPDYLQQDWTYNLAQKPEAYTDFDPPSLQIQVMPTAADAGLVELTYVADPPPFDGTGVVWVIPDITIPMAKWYALAILLAKDGRGQDLPRANVCEARANEGMTGLNILLNGWV